MKKEEEEASEKGSKKGRREGGEISIGRDIKVTFL